MLVPTMALDQAWIIRKSVIRKKEIIDHLIANALGL